MRTAPSRPITRLVSACVGALAAAAALAGPLSPPAGPPSPTMKTLDQIEPRRVLSSLPSSATAQFSITEPGQYYLTEDVSCPSGKSCIEVVCPGDVSIDLNGFSLVGAPGALDGISCPGPAGSAPGTPGGGGSGGSLAISGGEIKIKHKGWDGLIYHRSASGSSRIRGFTRAVSVGSPTGGGYADVSISSLHLDNCAQGIVHHNGQNVAHSSISSTCPGVSFSVSLDDVDAASPPSTRSYSASGLSVASSSSNGMFVSAPSAGGVLLTIRGSSFGRCASSGVSVVARQTQGATFGERMQAGVSSSSFSSCAVGLDISSPPGAGPHVKISEVSADSCSSVGVRVFTDNLVEMNETFARGCATGVHIKDAKLMLRSMNVVGGSSGLLLESVDNAECVRVAVGDVTGDGVSATGCGKVSFQDFHFSSRPPAAGASSSSRALSAHQCDVVSISRASSLDCGSDAFSFSSCGKVNVQDLSITKRSSSSFSSVRGIVFTDCSFTECVDVSISSCSSDGIAHLSNAQQGALSTRRGIAERGLKIFDCGGAGYRVQGTFSDGSSRDITLDRCVISSCAGGGFVLQSPSPASTTRVTCTSSRFCSCPSGFSVVGHPASSLSVSLHECDVSSNTGDGVSVVSSVSGQAFVGSSVLTMSSSSMTRNGGSGCVCHGGFTGSSCDFSDNGSTGFTGFTRDAFTLGGTLRDCTFARNAAVSMQCGPGRYSTERCQITDGGQDGIVLSGGCLIVLDSQVHRCAGDGIRVVGTLTMQGGASRRNGASGVTVSSGVCSMDGVSVQLNGLPPGTPVSGRTPGGITLVGCSSVSLHRCDITDNIGDGVSHVRGSMPLGTSCALTCSDCTVQRNSGNGLVLDACSGGQVVRCSVSNNAGIGIWTRSDFSGGTISDCVCTSNMGSIKVDGVTNLIRSNSVTTCAGMPVFTIAPGNTVGTIIDSAGVQQRCSPHDNVLH